MQDRNQHIYLYNIILLFLTFGFTGFSVAQSEIKPELINYPKNVYNAESQNWSIAQDENRVMYFANNDGLLVFDGEEWNVYPLPHPEIIRSVAADKKGKIYTGAFGEFGYWQKNIYGKYTYRSLDNLITDSLFKEEEIWRIMVMPDKVLFQSFSKIYLYKNEQISSIPVPGVVMFMFLVRDKIYVDVLDKGIYTINEENKLIPVTASTTVNPYKINFILPYGTNEMLVGTEKNGIFIFNGKDYVPFSCEADNFFKTNEINNGIQINDNLFAIGTTSGGFVLMNASGKTMYKIDKNSGLQNNTILNIYKDADDNCWLALDRGISQLILNSDIQYFKDVEGKIGTVYSIAIFQNYIYVATNHGLYYAPFTTLSRFDESTLQRFPNIANQVWDLKVVDDQLFCSDNSGTKIINNNAATNLMDSTGCYCITQIKTNPDILLQGTYFGIAVYRKINNRWTFSNFMQGTQNMPINKLKIDNRGLIWANYAYKAVFVIQPSADYKNVLAIKELDKAKNAPANIDFSFFEDAGNVFVNGKAGIFKFDFASNTLSKVDEYKNPFQEYYFSQTIIPDSTKGFWLVNSDAGIIYKSNQSDKLESYFFNSKIFELVSGYENIIPYNSFQSFVCGEEGFAVINRNKYNSTASAAPVFTQIQIFKKGYYEFIDSSYFDGKNIVLPHNQNGIIIHFSSLNYTQTVLYSYSLTENDEPVWSEWTSNPVKDFPNLSPGNYIFKVRTNLSNDISTLYIIIQSPWYWTAIAKIVYLVLLALIIYLFIRLHRERLAKQQLLLTKKMKEEVAIQRQKSENEILLLKQAQLSEEVVYKSEDLAKLAMDLIKKKNVLKKLRQNLDTLKTDNNINEVHTHIQKISKSLDKHINDEENEWHLFDNGFNKVHEEFFDRLLKKYPELTAQDLRLAAYLKMNLSTKEIAPLLNISTRGVEIKRYRLRKKLQLQENENLNDFMVKF